MIETAAGHKPHARIMNAIWVKLLREYSNEDTPSEHKQMSSVWPAIVQPPGEQTACYESPVWRHASLWQGTEHQSHPHPSAKHHCNLTVHLRSALVHSTRKGPKFGRKGGMAPYNGAAQNGKYATKERHSHLWLAVLIVSRVLTCRLASCPR